MESMFVPEPVVSLSIKPLDTNMNDNFSKGINRFMKEDPTFKVAYDADSKELIAYGTWIYYSFKNLNLSEFGFVK